jgi:hypothetical protein
MAEWANSDGDRSPEAAPISGSEYEAPRLIAIGNLHDLLAGTGTLPCDSGTIMTGPDPVVGTGSGECGPAG